MFVDKTGIYVKAGNGGNGAVAFHREKYITSGGPDGGDGGRGGNVVLQADKNMSTLMDFRYKRKFTAGNGGDGGGKKCSGKKGDDVVIKVPLGTVVRDKETNAVIKDISDDEPFILARGGSGGWGNAHFATPTRQSPRFAKSGKAGEEREVILELKLLADVGLVGLPNAGKSTLLSVVSRAHPKIANYPFTTLFPNLGVVYAGEGVSFVMADIPGLIEGASEGAGLGTDFLRHVDRCRLLIHLVDASGIEGRDPVDDFNAIDNELKKYDQNLAERPRILVASKCDILQDEGAVDQLRAIAQERGYPFHAISSASQSGTKALIDAIAAQLAHLPPIAVFEPEYIPPEDVESSPDDLEISVRRGVWSVVGDWLDRLVANVNFTDYESRMFFDRRLRSAGVYDRLEELGIQDGDTIEICGLRFEYRR